MYKILLGIFFLVSISLVILIILQQGKGAYVGVSLGSSNSSGLFGSIGSSNFIVRVTSVFAVLFFTISLSIDNINSNKSFEEKELKKMNTSSAHNQIKNVPTKPSISNKKPLVSNKRRPLLVSNKRKPLFLSNKRKPLVSNKRKPLVSNKRPLVSKNETHNYNIL